MRRSLLVTFVGSALIAASCPSEGPPLATCQAACEVAAACGILPSILGGKPGDDPAAMIDSCTIRCNTSETAGSVDSERVHGTLECLLSPESPGICGIDRCVDTIRCLRQRLPSDALGQPEVTFQLTDGELWTLLFEPELCNTIPPELLTISEEDKALICARDPDPCPPSPGSATPRLRPPLCVGDGCLDRESCDPRLCDFTVSAAYDCAFMGIETVQFGWLDERETLHLDPTIYSCDQAGAGQLVPGIGNEVIYPIAIFNGRITTRVLKIIDAPTTAEGRPYCWFSHPIFPPKIGWLVHAGPNVIAVPSPSSGWIAGELSDNPNIFPRGCGCLLGDVGCEDKDNANCDNGIDDDLDGLIDAEDPGCAP